MKKLLLLLLLCLTPLLAGCSSLYSQRRELEQLRLVETMGLDAAPFGLELSLSSAASEDEEPRCYRGTGLSLSQAMEQLRLRAGEELFCGHLYTILVGESCAEQGLEALLSAVCRSSDLRLDQPVLLVLDGRAGSAMAQGGDLSAALRALLPDQERTGALSSAGAILRDLNRQGSSLIRALRMEPSSEEGGNGCALVPGGYGILSPEGLLAQLSPEEGLAAELLTDSLSPCPLVIRDEQGRAVTLELQSSRLQLQPLWDREGALSGLDLRIRVQAAVLEIEGFPPAAEETYLNELSSRLEDVLSRRAGTVLALSRELGKDFLGLGRRLELAAPLRCRGLSRDLGTQLPSLSLRLDLQGELLHSNDFR